jgi:hypothetical protein
MIWESELSRKDIQAEYRWVPDYKGVEGNQKADQQATKAADKYQGKRTEIQNLPPYLNYVSFAHINQRLTEVKWKESKKKIQEMGRKSKHSYQYDLVKRGGNSAVMGS